MEEVSTVQFCSLVVTRLLTKCILPVEACGSSPWHCEQYHFHLPYTHNPLGLHLIILASRDPLSVVFPYSVSADADTHHASCRYRPNLTLQSMDRRCRTVQRGCRNAPPWSKFAWYYSGNTTAIVGSYANAALSMSVRYIVLPNMSLTENSLGM